ncbi:hypothetical protein DYI20_09775 [Auritidibacter ignavus]|nr:hypothetical protein DYI20_09775 [Auritidibacter ignavus]
MRDHSHTRGPALRVGIPKVLFHVFSSIKRVVAGGHASSEHGHSRWAVKVGTDGCQAGLRGGVRENPVNQSGLNTVSVVAFFMGFMPSPMGVMIFTCALATVLLWGVATGRFLGWLTDAIEPGAES